MKRIVGDDVARFWSKVNRGSPDDCWPWTAALNHGYGRMRLGDGRVYAHRFAYELLVGPIPEGLQIDHLCRNRACVNPAHMEPVTMLENVARGACWGFHPAKTHCPHGHEYTEENTHRTPEGWRACRACNRERMRAKRAAA